VRLEIVKGKWPDILKAARKAKVQFWKLGGTASSPDADTWLTALYGPNKEGNLAKFDLPAYDRLYERARSMQDGPGRTQIYQQMTKLVVSYVPWRVNTHRIRTSMWYPELIGFARSPILVYNFWKYVDIDPSAAARLAAR
jgi:ABC-type transport system substrate-binding protein